MRYRDQVSIANDGPEKSGEAQRASYTRRAASTISQCNKVKAAQSLPGPPGGREGHEISDLCTQAVIRTAVQQQRQVVSCRGVTAVLDRQAIPSLGADQVPLGLVVRAEIELRRRIIQMGGAIPILEGCDEVVPGSGVAALLAWRGCGQSIR